MNKLMTIAECLDNIAEMASNAQNMRRIINAGDKYTSDMRYQAIVNEEALLEVIKKYIDHITQLKELSVNGTVNHFNSKPARE